MKETHVILRRPRMDTSDVFLGAEAESVAAPAASGLTIDVDTIDRTDISALTSQPDVVAIAPSIPMRLIAPFENGVAPLPAEQGVAWGVKVVGADTSPFSGNGIVVAVLDTGIDATHPAFAGIDIVQKDFTGEGDGDQNGHGTHCAGTIFGRTTEGLRIAVAPGVKKVLIGKVIGQQGGSSDKIGSAILWAVENGAHVISMSLGIDFPGLVKRLQDDGFPAELATSRALEGYRANVQFFQSLASLIQARGAFLQTTMIIAAAGNESRREVRPDFEIAVSPPAVAEGIISVAALGQGDGGLVSASFSNTGANVSGPGVAITSAKLGGGLTAKSGTSMATPHVAGVTALWAEKIKSGSGALPSLVLKTRLLGSATSNGLKPGFDLFDVGLGLIRAPQE